MNSMHTLPPGSGIAEFTGPLIVGYLLHWGLFGTLTIQLYLYYEAFPTDRLSYKSLVYGIYIIELAQTILVTHDAFAVFGFGFGNLEAVIDIHFNWFTVPIMSGVVALIGQTFYAYRIHILSGSWIVPGFIVTISLISTVAGIIAGAFSFIAGNLITLNNHRISVAVGFWCSASAISDIIIAVCMTYCLARSDTGFRRTHALVTGLIRLTIETGTVTAIIALANLILFFAFPAHTYFGTPAVIMPKIYANTILVVLNARLQIVGGRSVYSSSTESTAVNSIPSSALCGSSGTSSVQPNAKQTIVTIKKDVFTDQHSDESLEMKPVARVANYA
ncbi:hypothetical protein BDZ94DRAFT_1217899 [Collybia nuda]|uniref:DUF6534 domain-containing protein n=1 Tax=Collybia nuda TaxID=64659 RepID=A0A9P5Y7C7_9AGAR|nr:hypothetical protein BDZ94DRAFT_1217899 [Collybia nuda]